MSTMLLENLMTIEEFAKACGCTAGRVRQWVADGQLPYVQVGKRLKLIERRFVSEWKESHKLGRPRMSKEKDS